MKMKLFLALLILIFSVSVINAQIAVKDAKFFNAGIGFGTNLYSGSYYALQVPPLSVSLEYILKDDILDGKGALGAGGYLGFASYKYDVANWGWKYTSIVIGPRGYFHYNFLEQLDTYTGVLIGYNILSSKSFGNIPGWNTNASSGGLAYSWFVGGRYFFSDNLAAMAELGWGVAYLNVGICMKL